MRTRMLRGGLLESEAWLGLKNNDDRVCWITLFLNADTFGNQPAGLLRIVHLCRYAGIDTTEKAAKVLAELADTDLIRLYQEDDKPFCHIPRFSQSPRFPGKLWPLSPWTTDEQKQALAKKSPEDHGESPHGVGGRGVVLGVGEDQKQKQTTPPKSKAPARAPFIPPDWIPRTEWDAWIEARTKKKNPPTNYALGLAVCKLENFKERGHPPGQVLMRSAMNGWADLFEPKEV